MKQTGRNESAGSGAATLRSAQDRLEVGLVNLCERRVRVETELVGCLLSGPEKGMRAVRAYGVTHHHFSRGDLRWIYLAAEVAGEQGKEAVVRLAERALRDAGLWDERVEATDWSGPTWGKASLRALADSHPAPLMAESLARELVDLERRLHEARQCWKRLLSLVEGATDPFTVRVGVPRVILSKSKGGPPWGSAPDPGV